MRLQRNLARDALYEVRMAVNNHEPLFRWGLRRKSGFRRIFLRQGLTPSNGCISEKAESIFDSGQREDASMQKLTEWVGKHKNRVDLFYLPLYSLG
jgi:hypothetical protein